MKQLRNKKITLDTDRLILRTLVPEDVSPSYVQGINNTEVNNYLLLSDKGKQTIESVSAYVQENLNSFNALLLGIFLKHNNKLIGTIRLSDISLYHYCCNVGICIFLKQYWKKGFAHEALKRVIGFAFDYLGMHYIEAGVFSENISSLNLFLRSGFKMCYTNPDKLRLKNKFAEISVLSIINPDFDFNKLSIHKTS